MAIEWFRGVALSVLFDEQRIRFVANNGRVPPLDVSAHAFVTATVEHGALVLTGAFEQDTRIALRVPPADARGIADALARELGLPRHARPTTLADLAQLPNGAFVALEGRCSPYGDGSRMENRIALLGVKGRVEHDAPYRVTGFYQRGAREELRVLGIEHLNPPVTWFTGQSVSLTHAPHRELIGLVPRPHHSFTSPPGILELWLPVRTLTSARVDGDGIVFEGDLEQTGYGTLVRLAPVAANDASTIVALLGERLGLPRIPRSITATQVATTTTVELVQIDGTYRPGHFEGPNFDGDIQVKRAEGLVVGSRYRVTGVLYPRREPGDLYIGYTGPRLVPLAVVRL